MRGRWGDQTLRPLRALLAGLLLAAPAAPGTGSDIRAVIARAEQLRGLRRRIRSRSRRSTPQGCAASCCASWRASGDPRSDAAWDDALHLLGVLKAGQSLAQVERGKLTGPGRGLYVPATGRLYVLGSPEAPRRAR